MCRPPFATHERRRVVGSCPPFATHERRRVLSARADGASTARAEVAPRGAPPPPVPWFAPNVSPSPALPAPPRRSAGPPRSVFHLPPRSFVPPHPFVPPSAAALLPSASLHLLPSAAAALPFLPPLRSARYWFDQLLCGCEIENEDPEYDSHLSYTKAVDYDGLFEYAAAARRKKIGGRYDDDDDSDSDSDRDEDEKIQLIG